MPDWIKEVGPTAAVAIAAMYLFLGALDKWGKSRDLEREAHMKMLEERDKAAAKMVEHFTGAVVLLVGLAQTMVNGCQKNVSPLDRVSSDDVTAAARSLLKDNQQ